MATTTNYSWSTPDDTALVKDGAAAIRSLGTAIDSTVFTNAGAAVTKATVDAKGDLIAGTADNTIARLAVGSNDQVLTADSSTATGLKWAVPPAGGMTLINTGGTTLTGASVTISSIPADYIHLQLIIQSPRPASDGNIHYRFNGDSGTNYREVSIGTGTDNSGFDTDKLVMGVNMDNGTSKGIVVINVFDYKNTSTWKMSQARHMVNHQTSTSNFNYRTDDQFYNTTSAITSITLLPSGASWTSGTAYLYGVK